MGKPFQVDGLVHGRLVYGLGAILLGVVGFAFDDFALQWQPVPGGFPAREAAAYLSAALLCLGGAAVIWKQTTAYGAQLLATFYGLWVVALHLPKVIADPAGVATWLGVAEILALASAGVMLCVLVEPPADPRVRTAARIAFGLCPLVFGLSHFVYAEFTATMVPGWIPLPLFWAYATGAGHVAAGLAILSGVQARLASGLLAAMFAVFALVLHLPRVIAAPSSQIEWTMLGIATSLTGAALIIWRSTVKA